MKKLQCCYQFSMLREKLYIQMCTQFDMFYHSPLLNYMGTNDVNFIMYELLEFLRE
jgi:hypothetical protein